MAAIDDLKTEWETQIATISDDLQRKAALVELDNFIAAKISLATLEASNVSSYSITNRTVTRVDLTGKQAAVQSLEDKLFAYVYGTDTFATMDVAHGTRIR